MGDSLSMTPRQTDALSSLHELTKLTLQVLNEFGDAIFTCGETCAYCKLFKPYLHENESCKGEHARAAERALELGEAYIFCCHANVDHIVLPLLRDREYVGAVLAGPFLISPPDALLLQEVAGNYDIPASVLLDMYEAAMELRVMPPGEVRSMSRLMLYLFDSFGSALQAGDVAESRIPDDATTTASGASTLQSRRDVQLQQSRIGETVQLYKASAAQAYPYNKERELIARVKAGDTASAKAVLNELLGYTFFSEGTELGSVKARAVELCSLLSRAAIESGSPSETTLEAGHRFARSLWQVGELEQLCYRLQEAVEYFAGSAFERYGVKNRTIITKAIRYIAMNYAEPITLNDVAAEVHLNPTYFSTVFKQGAGSSFKEYLNMVRVEESRRLLDSTDSEVTQIAFDVGFESQNYYSKVFREHMGMSPREYRQRAHNPK